MTWPAFFCIWEVPAQSTCFSFHSTLLSIIGNSRKHRGLERAGKVGLRNQLTVRAVAAEFLHCLWKDSNLLYCANRRSIDIKRKRLFLVKLLCIHWIYTCHKEWNCCKKSSSRSCKRATPRSKPTWLRPPPTHPTCPIGPSTWPWRRSPGWGIL